MNLTFCGGVKIVTGANYLLESEGHKFLVDCGLAQGSRFCEQFNFDPFSYNPKEIEAVLITHAHIDHIGRLPKLYKDGFRGKVYSTFPTRDSAELLLIDSEHILKQEAEHSQREPLYALDDVNNLMTHWQGIDYHQPIEFGLPNSRIKAVFYNAGHILGSSFIVIEDSRKQRLVFSGDLGNAPMPLLPPPEQFEEGNYCLIESAYGDRIHEDLAQRKEILEDAIEDTVKAGGVLMIPAFAMERTQELLFELNELAENGRIPRVPIFVDSPLAIKLTAVYQKYRDYFSEGAASLIKAGDAIFNFPGLKMTLTTEESKTINDVAPPKIIIAGSGMSHGGRILHHERRYLSDSRSMLLIIGYQAMGSLGRQILDGAKMVKIFGEDIAVNCRFKAIGGYSAHADQPQLLDWLRPMQKGLKKVFVVQGEDSASQTLAQKIKDELAVEARVPDLGMKCEL